MKPEERGYVLGVGARSSQGVKGHMCSSEAREGVVYVVSKVVVVVVVVVTN